MAKPIDFCVEAMYTFKELDKTNKKRRETGNLHIAVTLKKGDFQHDYFTTLPLLCPVFFPRPVQQRAYAIGLADRESITKRRKRFMTLFYLVMLGALLLIIGGRSDCGGVGNSDFLTNP